MYFRWFTLKGTGGLGVLPSPPVKVLRLEVSFLFAPSSPCPQERHRVPRGPPARRLPRTRRVLLLLQVLLLRLPEGWHRLPVGHQLLQYYYSIYYANCNDYNYKYYNNDYNYECDYNYYNSDQPLVQDSVSVDKD